jgi:hypothetical protein
MKYRVGTKLHIWFNDEKEKPMYGHIHGIEGNEYDIEWVYSHKMKPVRGNYSDDEVVRICTNDHTYFKVEKPSYLPEDLFTL